MPEASRKLILAKNLFHRLTNIKWDGTDFIGVIERSEENCQLLSDCESEGLLFAFDIRFLQPVIGLYIEVQAQPPRYQSGFFAKSVDELLAQADFSYKTPESFYLVDKDELYPDSEELPSDLVQGYLHTIRLIHLLRTVADHEDVSTGKMRLVLLLKEKIEIIVGYERNALRIMPELVELESLLGEQMHQEQRRTIFKKLLLEELKQIDVADRFRKIIERLPELFRRFIDNYQLYVSEFSFDKVFRDVSDKRLECILKLNKNFSEMQNQLLAVPIATLLACSQMGPSNGNIRNGLVLFVTVIFSCFMSMLLRNQRASLDAIKQEIDHQKDSLKREHAALNSKFDEIYSDIDRRYEKHKCLLHLVDLAVAITLVLLPAILFVWYSGL